MSGIGLGFSQPFFMPGSSFSIGDTQKWLGLLSLISYVPLFLLITKENVKSTFIFSSLTMVVHFLITFYWIFVPLNVYGGVHWFLSAIIILLMAIVLALLVAPFITIGRFLSQKFSCDFLFVAPLALCAGEYFRNYFVFGGFPWGNVGYSLGRVDQLLQFASVVGVYGLVLLAGVFNSIAASIIIRKQFKTKAILGASFLALLVFLFMFGQLKLNNSKKYAPSIRVALLQGNIPQSLKHEGSFYGSDILKIYQQLFNKAKKADADLIVWPESAYPRVVREDRSYMDYTGTRGLYNIIGSVAYGELDNKSIVRNSAFVVDGLGKVIKRYDKSHLVPFGEYVPWPMSGLVDRVVPGMGAFVTGSDFSPVKLNVDGIGTLKAGITICYEGLFPEISRSYAKQGTDILINMTNDAWYNDTSAPFQHLLKYRMRSVETGIPFLRATNTGISAWIDANGHIRKWLKLYDRDVLIDDVPLLKIDTIYAKLGDVVPIICMLIILILYICSVVPLLDFIKKKQWVNISVIFFLFAIAVIGQIYFSRPQFMLDESAKTKSLFITIYCFLFMLGALSNSKKVKLFLKVMGIIIILLSVALIVFESSSFFIGIVLGQLIYLLAFRIRS